MMEENGISYPDIKQSWGIVGICILSMILFSPVSILLDTFAGKEISFLIYYLVSMGATFWIVHLKRRKWTGVDGYDFAFSSPRISILVSLAVISIQLGIVSPVVSLIPMPEFVKDIVLEFASRHGVFSFIAIVIAAPVLEELIFRGIILNGLLKRYSPVKSIFISSLLFGVVHLNPWQFVAAFIVGIFSGWLYYKTKKLSLSILIHFSNNLFAFCFTYFMDAESIVNKSLPELYGGFLNLIVITVGAMVVSIICLYVIRLEIKDAETNQGGTQHYI